MPKSSQKDLNKLLNDCIAVLRIGGNVNDFVNKHYISSNSISSISQEILPNEGSNEGL